MNNWLDLFYKDALKSIDLRREEEIIKFLESLGFVFPDRENLETFCKSRLTEKSYEDRPDYRELWLDYGGPNPKLLTTYYDRYDIQFKNVDDKVVCNITWGAKPSHTPSPQ